MGVKPVDGVLESSFFALLHVRVTQITSNGEAVRATRKIDSSVSLRLRRAATEDFVTDFLLFWRVHLIDLTRVYVQWDFSLFDLLKVPRYLKQRRVGNDCSLDNSGGAELKNVFSSKAITGGSERCDSTFLQTSDDFVKRWTGLLGSMGFEPFLDGFLFRGKY